MLFKIKLSNPSKLNLNLLLPGFFQKTSPKLALILVEILFVKVLTLTKILERIAGIGLTKNPELCAPKDILLYL